MSVHGRAVVVAITTVVALSVLLHGASAAPIASKFGAAHPDAALDHSSAPSEEPARD